MLKTLSVSAAGAVFLLMVLGGVVSATGSGLGCGPNWPLCNGRLIPPFDQLEVFIEWFHRLAAALAGLLVLGAAIAVRRESPLLAGLALGLLVVQVLLGALTVRLELPPAASTAHLAVGTALFAVLIAMVALAPPGKRPRATAVPSALPFGLLWAATLVTYTQMVLGAYVRHSGAGLACPDPIICLPSEHLAVTVHFLHRLMALVVLGLVHAAGGRVLRATRAFSLRAVALGAMLAVVAQIGLGVLSVSTRLFPHVTTTHLTVALLLLGTLTYLTAKVTLWRQSAAAAISTPAAH
jgi:heme A synthase